MRSVPLTWIGLSMFIIQWCSLKSYAESMTRPTLSHCHVPETSWVSHDVYEYFVLSKGEIHFFNLIKNVVKFVSYSNMMPVLQICFFFLPKVCIIFASGMWRVAEVCWWAWCCWTLLHSHQTKYESSFEYSWPSSQSGVWTRNPRVPCRWSQWQRWRRHKYQSCSSC